MSIIWTDACRPMYKDSWYKMVKEMVEQEWRVREETAHEGCFIFPYKSLFEEVVCEHGDNKILWYDEEQILKTFKSKTYFH